MNTVERLNAVIDYVEKHITEKLELNQLAEIACYSLHDFQRMFRFITEMSITEYIRKRRLTLAGFDLQQNNAKVMNVASKNFEQMKARIHRSGQKHDCLYIYLTAKGTVDEKVLSALRDKADLAASLVDDCRNGKNPYE